LLANYPSGRVRDWTIQPGKEQQVEAWVKHLEAEYTRQTGLTVKVVPGSGGSGVYGEMDMMSGQITIFHGEQFGGAVTGGRPLTMRDGGILWDGGMVAQPVRGVSAYRLEELYHWYQVTGSDKTRHGS
jgi:hypothetical protein